MVSHISVMVASVSTLLAAADAFHAQKPVRRHHPLETRLRSAASSDDPWENFVSHHTGAWMGVWESFDRLGDKADVSEVLFDVELSPDGEAARLSQTIVVEVGCEACQESCAQFSQTRSELVPFWGEPSKCA